MLFMAYMKALSAYYNKHIALRETEREIENNIKMGVPISHLTPIIKINEGHLELAVYHLEKAWKMICEMCARDSPQT